MCDYLGTMWLLGYLEDFASNISILVGIRIRFFFIIRQIRRRKNLDFKSSKGKSADFTEQNCWQVSLFKNSSLSEIPHEILTAEKEIESENLQKLCYEMDQMYIEQDFSFETETRDLILVGENDEDEMVTLEFIPESEE